MSTSHESSRPVPWRMVLLAILAVTLVLAAWTWLQHPAPPARPAGKMIRIDDGIYAACVLYRGQLACLADAFEPDPRAASAP